MVKAIVTNHNTSHVYGMKRIHIFCRIDIFNYQLLIKPFGNGDCTKIPSISCFHLVCVPNPLILLEWSLPVTHILPNEFQLPDMPAFYFYVCFGSGIFTNNHNRQTGMNPFSFSCFTSSATLALLPLQILLFH